MEILSESIMLGMPGIVNLKMLDENEIVIIAETLLKTGTHAELIETGLTFATATTSHDEEFLIYTINIPTFYEGTYDEIRILPIINESRGI